MSMFSIANPVKPTIKTPSGDVDIKSLFKGPAGAIGNDAASPLERFMSGKSRIKSVKVEIFDLSKDKERGKYEKLWASLLNRMSAGDVVVDSHQDLVHRADGGSYWMKYVEFIEFEGTEEVKKEV